VLDEPARDDLVEAVGDELWEHGGELVDGGAGAGFVEVDELVGFEAEDLAEVGAVSPGPDQVADPGERVAAILEPPDEVEAGDVGGPVDPDAAPSLRRGEQPHRLVLADGAHGQAGAGAELVDGQLVRSRGGLRGRIHG